MYLSYSWRRYILLPRISQSVAGVMVSIVAFQAVDPGSIPGRRTVFFIFLFFVFPPNSLQNMHRAKRRNGGHSCSLFFFVISVADHSFVFLPSTDTDCIGTSYLGEWREIKFSVI